MNKLSPLVVLLAVLAFGCGENLQTQAPASPFGPPSDLKAVSLSQSSVRIHWSAASGSTDSLFRGYSVQVGNRRDTLSKSVVSFVADQLPVGEALFSVYSLRTDGIRSEAATIRWAPAARFDSAFNVFENNTLTSSRPEGFNVGTATTNPSVMVIDPLSQTVQQTMDFYFNGGTPQVRQPLSVWSANLFIGSFNRTKFSTETDSSGSLDYPLVVFPAENTFTKDSVSVVDNTIYYAKVIGDPQQVNYARIHLRLKPGTVFPNRVVEVRVSLQRAPGLLYAHHRFSFFNHNQS